MKKIIFLFLIFSILSCQPVEKLDTIVFDNNQLSKFDILSNTIEINEIFEKKFSEPFIGHTIEVDPAQRIINWLNDNFRAIGNENVFVISIIDASLTQTEFENDLGNLTKLSTESDAIQVNVATRLASGSTTGWKTALYEAKLEDYYLKTTPKLDYKVKDRFGLPQSIMKFNDSGSELKNIINIVNQDEELRPIKGSTRFGITPVRLHQMNPDQCAFSIDYYTDPNSLLLDPFSGRSTTAITSLYLSKIMK